MCVYDFLKENDFAPFPRQHIQSFARQLLGSVACTTLFSFFATVHVAEYRHVSVLHELHLIHTDLKPENILLVNNDYQVVQVPTSSKVMLQRHSTRI